MRLCLLTTSVSPHQVPLARQLGLLVGSDNFRYVATGDLDGERRRLGWGISGDCERWILHLQKGAEEAEEASRWAEGADVLLTGSRDVGLLERRIRNGKLNLYMSERWFKPPWGMARLLYPRYFGMARKIVYLMQSPYFYYLPIGGYAVQDMTQLAGVFGAREAVKGKMRMWGYFVSEKDHAERQMRVEGKIETKGKRVFRILWFGRLLKLKRVDTLIKAVAWIHDGINLLQKNKGTKEKNGMLDNCRLKIVGLGPEGGVLRALAVKLGVGNVIEFCPPVPIERVREEIRASDVCVVTSNGQEGWGVAVNEILLEGRCAVVSKESGAGATLIRDGENGLLFKSGDVADLARQLQRVLEDARLRTRLAETGRASMLAVWTPDVAAERLMTFCESMLNKKKPPQWETGPLTLSSYR